MNKIKSLFQFKRLSMSQKKSLEGLMYVLPWIIGFLVFVAYPLGRTIYFSFNRVNFVAPNYTYDWIGWKNYKEILFIHHDLIIKLQDFIVKILLYVPVIISLSVIIAVLLNNKLKGTTFFRIIFFLPIIILNGELLKNMSGNGTMSITVNGLIINVVEKIAPAEMVGLILQLFNTIIETLWYCGVPILIFLAALQKIDKSLYEASQIDGAGPWNTFWKITLPTVYPLVSVAIVYIVVFLANFDGNPITQAIIDAKDDPTRRYGYASAMALIYTIVQTLLIILLYLLTRRKERKGDNR